MIKDIIIGIGLMWSVCSSIIITNIILYNLKIGILKEKPDFYNKSKLKKCDRLYMFLGKKRGKDK